MIKATEKLYAYIPDGYTTTGFLRGVPGLYPDVSFHYRPLQRLQQQRVMMDLGEGLRGAKAIETLQHVYAELICEQIIDWDIQMNSRELVPLKANEALRLQPQLFERLLEVLMGRVPADIPPTDFPQRDILGEQDPKAILHAALDGESVEETLEGN